MIAAGLVVEGDGGRCYDRFRDRVTIPIRAIRGNLIAFGGRTVGDDTPKYLNSPETALFAKSQVLFALDRAAAGVRHERPRDRRRGLLRLPGAARRRPHRDRGHPRHEPVRAPRAGAGPEGPACGGLLRRRRRRPHGGGHRGAHPARRRPRHRGVAASRGAGPRRRRPPRGCCGISPSSSRAPCRSASSSSASSDEAGRSVATTCCVSSRSRTPARTRCGATHFASRSPRRPASRPSSSAPSLRRE